MAAAGWRLFKTMGGDALGAAGAAIFALFNPWVYTEVVAGHLDMVLAIAACAILISELFTRRPNSYLMTFTLIVSLIQLQVFFIGLAILVVWAIIKRDKDVVGPLATGVVIASPSLFGVFANAHSLLQIPFNLTWQRSESLNPFRVLELEGYYAHYTKGFPAYSEAALVGVLAIAGAGAFIALRDRSTRLLPLAVGAVWLFVTGTKGPASAAYSWLVLNFTEIGFFRELYDLVGFLVIGYLVFTAVVVSRSRALRGIWLGLTTLVALAWIASPPSRYWVGLSSLPATVVSTAPNSRFALFPAFQPLIYRGRGAGLDPAAYMQPQNIAPLNGETVSYPVNTALAQYEYDGDTSPLAGLSVTQVIDQRWLRVDSGALLKILARPKAVPFPIPQPSRKISRPLPELTLNDLPRISRIGRSYSTNQVLFSDASGLTGPGVPEPWRNLGRIHPFHASNARLRASSGWVDVRGLFAEQPSLGQGIGGVVTTSQKAVFNLPKGLDGFRSMLVNVTGVLYSTSGSTILTSHGGYRWIRLRRDLRAVRCDGECVLVAAGNPPAPTRIPTQQPTMRALAFNALTPWLVIARLPAVPHPSLLRYNVAYSRYWLAILGPRPLVHVRLSTLFNGWIITNAHPPQLIIMVEIVAAIQAILEALAMGWVAVLLWLYARDRLFSRSPS